MYPTLNTHSTPFISQPQEDATSNSTHYFWEPMITHNGTPNLHRVGTVPNPEEIKSHTINQTGTQPRKEHNNFLDESIKKRIIHILKYAAFILTCIIVCPITVAIGLLSIHIINAINNYKHYKKFHTYEAYHFKQECITLNNIYIDKLKDEFTEHGNLLYDREDEINIVIAQKKPKEDTPCSNCNLLSLPTDRYDNLIEEISKCGGQVNKKTTTCSNIEKRLVKSHQQMKSKALEKPDSSINDHNHCCLAKINNAVKEINTKEDTCDHLKLNPVKACEICCGIVNTKIFSFIPTIIKTILFSILKIPENIFSAIFLGINDPAYYICSLIFNKDKPRNVFPFTCEYSSIKNNIKLIFFNPHCPACNSKQRACNSKHRACNSKQRACNSQVFHCQRPSHPS